jgi:hypothetical protein
MTDINQPGEMMGEQRTEVERRTEVARIERLLDDHWRSAVATWTWTMSSKPSLVFFRKPTPRNDGISLFPIRPNGVPIRMR